MRIPAKCDGCGCLVDIKDERTHRIWCRTKLCRGCLELMLGAGKPVNFAPQAEEYDPCDIVCPYCGYSRQACEPGDYDSGTHICGMCGRDFDLHVETAYYFSTRPLGQGDQA